ncbi:MAG: class IV adenylate cyclase [Euryarchaeota archaeon]|nr:class IV adenylate cyclase [Euryarchaeota archaeon]
MTSAGTVEVEVKSRVGDLRALERRLRGMGGRLREEVVEIDTYYNHPSRDFASTDEALRVRVSRGEVSLTYKGPKLDRTSKSREEIILGIDDAARAGALLARLGFRRVASVRKRRRAFGLGRFEICLDRVAGLGDFFEIEARVPRRGYGGVRDEALALLLELGGERPERRSYLELLLSKGDRR